MRKPKIKSKRLADHKRASKRGLRLKKTQAEKGRKKLKIRLEKKEKVKKYQEMINKVLESRAAK